MKRAAEHVRPDDPWEEAREVLLAKGFSVIGKMRPEDAEKVRRRSCSACVAMRSVVGAAY